MGTPAVMTTICPLCTAPSLSALCTHMEKRRSVESTYPASSGCTPQEMASCRRARSVVVRATMGQAGRKRAIMRAVWPVCVGVRMASASRSMAVWQQVWVTASLMERPGVNSKRRKRPQ